MTAKKPGIFIIQFAQKLNLPSFGHSIVSPPVLVRVRVSILRAITHVKMV